MSFNEVVINSVEIYKADIPLRKAELLSIGEFRATNNIIIRLNTNTGLYGFGECCLIKEVTGETQSLAFEKAKLFAKILLNKNPLEIKNCNDELEKAAADNNHSLKSAFDMALYDIMGKYCKLPLCLLVGGYKKRKITTSITIGIDTPEKMANEALYRCRSGFTTLKIKLGTSVKEDIARVKSIREKIGYDISIKIDANQGWDVETAINVLKKLESYKIQFCEQPISSHNINELAYVSKNSPVPIMADESLHNINDLIMLKEKKACDYYNIKLAKSGGIYSTLKMLSMADSYGLKLQVGCMLETRYALTTATHLALVSNSVFFFDLDASLFLEKDPVVGGITYLENGDINMHLSPGIGAFFDQSFLDNLECIKIQTAN